ncbi:hypothetical protein K5F93_20060 [Pseudomonas protegens]|uniref:hypothetical protein n=1 Tax=Pseudomonas protegens TaxID=380021 RepID=UPI001C8E2EBE|nr:hypothetical protein [Pseudomonas protegens]QZI73832.1 hypothetical protein K5F93_20060 [Pseudomonas protegens]
MSDYKNPVCRGSWDLGSACGRCERCKETSPGGNVTPLHGPTAIGHGISSAATDLDAAIVLAIDAAKAAGLPQGLIVGLLHGHAHAQTHQMVTK